MGHDFLDTLSYILHVVIHLSACISTCGNLHFSMYFRIWKLPPPPKKSVFPPVFTRGNLSACRFTWGNTLSRLGLRLNFHTWKSAKNLYFRTLGNSQFSVYFRIWKYTILREFPHVEKRISAHADLHRILCISTSSNNSIQFNSIFISI